MLGPSAGFMMLCSRDMITHRESVAQDAGAEELFQAMELEMEARAPSNAAYLTPPPGPLSAFGTWALSFIIPGLGMFTEAYFVFSVRALVAACKVGSRAKHSSALHLQDAHDQASARIKCCC